MTTSAAVRTAWQQSVWDSQAVRALTENVFLYEPFVDAEFDVESLKYTSDASAPPVVNYFTCLVARTVRFGEMRTVEQRFDVQVLYHLQQEGVADSNYNAVQDGIEAVDDLVTAALGHSWGGTVDFFEQTEALRPERVTVGNLACWRAGYRYTAFKRTDL